MKLTDKEIIEALNVGKMIRTFDGVYRYKLDENRDLVNEGTGRPLSLNFKIFEYDFEIVEPEIDWDKVIREKYLCKFWDTDAEPNFAYNYSIDELIGYADNSVKKDFQASSEMWWKHCRPLRADEVKLVTDEKELWK